MFKASANSKEYDQKNSFFYLVLRALKDLHGSKKTAQGARLKDVVEYFENNYKFEGDLLSQIKNALDIATLQLKSSDDQNVEIDRIQKIFEPAWWEKNKSKSFSKKNKNSNSVNKTGCQCSVRNETKETNHPSVRNQNKEQTQCARNQNKEKNQSCKDSKRKQQKQSDNDFSDSSLDTLKSTDTCNYTLGNTFKKFANSLSNKFQQNSTVKKINCSQNRNGNTSMNTRANKSKNKFQQNSTLKRNNFSQKRKCDKMSMNTKANKSKKQKKSCCSCQ